MLTPEVWNPYCIDYSGLVYEVSNKTGECKICTDKSRAHLAVKHCTRCGLGQHIYAECPGSEITSEFKKKFPHRVNYPVDTLDGLSRNYSPKFAHQATTSLKSSLTSPLWSPNDKQEVDLPVKVRSDKNKSTVIINLPRQKGRKPKLTPRRSLNESSGEYLQILSTEYANAPTKPPRERINVEELEAVVS